MSYSLVERQGENVMGKADIDVLQGTLDLLILKAVSLEAMHGWGIAQRIQQISRDALQVNQGSLYPALHRLEDRGWITAKWGTSENNRKARFYRLTAAGRAQLATETANWERFALAMQRVLSAEPV
jgi:transcriptional regulator